MAEIEPIPAKWPLWDRTIPVQTRVNRPQNRVKTSPWLKSAQQSRASSLESYSLRPRGRLRAGSRGAAPGENKRVWLYLCEENRLEMGTDLRGSRTSRTRCHVWETDTRTVSPGHLRTQDNVLRTPSGHRQDTVKTLRTQDN